MILATPCHSLGTGNEVCLIFITTILFPLPAYIKKRNYEWALLNIMGILLIPLIDEHLPTDDGDTGSDGSRDDESDNDESLTPPHIEQDNNEDNRPRPDRYIVVFYIRTLPVKERYCQENLCCTG